MPIIRFLPSGRDIKTERGTTLLEAAREAGVGLDSPCGGEGTCGRCAVRVASGRVDQGRLGLLSSEAAAAGAVLACEARVLDEDLVVDVPEKTGWKGGQFSADGDDFALGAAELDPAAAKIALEVPPPRRDEGLADLDRITRQYARLGGSGSTRYSLTAARRAAEALRALDGRITATVVLEPGAPTIIDIEAGDRGNGCLGAAIDIGTTTIAVRLVSMADGKPLRTEYEYNAQIACGLDVISRINYAREAGRLEELRERVLGTINGLVERVCSAVGARPADIAYAVAAGNPTMIHLALGLKPEYLRIDPYTPTLSSLPPFRAAETGIAMHPEGLVYFCPSVGSYVGGDITAGVLCTDLAGSVGAEGGSGARLSLFMDIGTNGEIVLGGRDFLMACACSAGPAFEGGGIECGMRAAEGAIDGIRVDPETGAPTISTISGSKPVGICGSGMIGLLAELYLSGWMDGQGRLDRNRSSNAIEIEGRRARYILAPKGESGTGAALYVSEADIANVLRAKAAIYSASSMLLESLGLGYGDLARVYIAGGFGRFLDIGDAVVLGLLPDLPREKFVYLGNASLAGAYMVLVSRERGKRMREAAARMTYVDLGSESSYMDHYTAALFVPHTDARRFPSVGALRSDRAAQVRPEAARARPDVAQVRPDAARARPDAARGPKD